MKTENTKYKDSGVEWIGEIPEGWEVIPFKQMYNLGKGLSITKADLVENGVPVISYGQIHSKNNTGTTVKDELIRYVPTSYLENNPDALVKVGDIIFADTSEDLEGCGNCIYIDRDMALFAGYHTIIASNRTDTATRYLSYLFKTDCWRTQIRAVVNGVKLFSIPQKTLAATSIITPPLPTQQRIADFLDRKCAEIDELSALQETMIAELKRYKQSVITEAVTKGLDKNVKFKDSGVEWIGEIPEGWGVCRLKDVVHKRNEKAPNSNFKYIGLEHLVSFSKEIVTTENVYDSDGANMCYTNDVIFGKLRPYLGKAKVIEETCCCSSEFLVLSNSQCPNYLRYLILSGWFIEIVNASTYGTKMPRANADFILNMQVPIAPLAEQQAIADYLDEKCGEIDELIAIKQQKIEQLKEYKKSVMFEYVTGKKEVER